ncbi:MAG: hypothetical protein QXK76_01835 [Candidatus Woesearchaeota archaeon]
MKLASIPIIHISEDDSRDTICETGESVVESMLESVKAKIIIIDKVLEIHDNKKTMTIFKITTEKNTLNQIMRRLK